MLREGNQVVIAKTGNPTCPVRILEKYLLHSDIDALSSEFIFRQIVFCKSQNKYILKSTDKPLSYSSVRDIFKSKLKVLDLDPSKFGLHSFRSGAASASANSHVSERLIQRHGRWRCSSSKDAYVQDSLDDKLSVSRNLNL